jgi:hypothetical protein
MHAERLNACGCVFVHALPQCQHQRLNALPMVEFPSPIFVESGSIAISFGHTPRLAGRAKSYCAVWHMLPLANPLLSERG